MSIKKFFPLLLRRSESPCPTSKALRFVGEFNGEIIKTNAKIARLNPDIVSKSLGLFALFKKLILVGHALYNTMHKTKVTNNAR